MANSEPSDVLIVGGGIAGLSLTLQLPGNARITLIAKAALDEGASLYAQSGIAAVLDEVRDSLAAHIEDTLRAGAGLCHRQAVEHVIRHGPDATRWLIAQGVPFSHEDGPDGAARYHLTREGGHSHFRVTNNLLELRNLVLIAELNVRCALAHHESRGLHFTRDYPQVDPHTAGRDTVLSPPSFEQLDAPANA